jgi:ubiquitin C-terminal hydrolase
MIIHRISNGEPITKNFTISEEIFLNNKTGIFEKESSSISSILYELKFIIVHSFSNRYSGHYYSYCKIKEEWYVFNDCHDGDAKQENPPLTIFSENVFPICFYFVKSK